VVHKDFPSCNPLSAPDASMGRKHAVPDEASKVSTNLEMSKWLKGIIGGPGRSRAAFYMQRWREPAPWEVGASTSVPRCPLAASFALRGTLWRGAALARLTIVRLVFPDFEQARLDPGAR